MPIRKCYVCRQATQMSDFEITCKDCAAKELDLLIGVYWFMHNYGSEFCPVRTLYLEVESVGNMKVVPDIMRSWLSRGYLEINDMSCVRVPPPVINHLSQCGFNPTPQFNDTLRKVEVEHREKVRKEATRPVIHEEEHGPRIRMIYQEGSERR